MSKVVLEIGSIPTSSDTNTISIYPKSDKKLYYIDEDSVETEIGNGIDGVDGRTIRTGVGAPSNGLGLDGDLYIDQTAPFTWYEKVTSAYVNRGNLQGADGNAVLNGTVDPTSGVGVDGDFYLNTTTFVMFGPKLSGAWGSGFDLLTPVVPRNYFDFIVGTQPSAPDAGNVRFWLGTLGINVLNQAAQNTRFPSTPTETEVFEVQPQYLLNVYDPSISDYRSVSATTIAPLAVEQRYVMYDEDDFASATGSAFKLGWGATNSGTGASVQSGTYGVNGTEKAYGVAQLDTGTTSTGRASLYRQDNQIMLGFTKFNMRWRAAIEDLSTVTERFFVLLGFSDSRNTSGVGTDGVYFYYSDDLYGGNWACVTRAAGIETSVDSGVAASTQYVRLEIEIAENGSQVMFYIAENLVATIVTNIPTTQGDFTGIVAKIQKSIGTTQRNLSLDYHNLKGIWTGGR